MFIIIEVKIKNLKDFFDNKRSYFLLYVLANLNV